MIKLRKKGGRFKFRTKLASWILKLIGWQAIGEVPKDPKYVMVGYPHTSNWDVPVGLLIFTALGVRLHWVGKHTLFKFPLSLITKTIGGIPVNRSTTKNFVQQVIDVFNNSEKLVLTVSPEGTRKKTNFWRTGFYYIAQGANIPIATGFLDYKNKQGGFGPLVKPSGDIEADFKIFYDFYSTKTGKLPQDMADIRLNKE